METKEALLYQFSRTNPATSELPAEVLKYERDKVLLETLLDLRDATVKLSEKK